MRGHWEHRSGHLNRTTQSSNGISIDTSELFANAHHRLTVETLWTSKSKPLPQHGTGYRINHLLLQIVPAKDHHLCDNLPEQENRKRVPQLSNNSLNRAYKVFLNPSSLLC